MNKLGLRRRLFVAVLLTVGLALVALVAGFNVVLARTLDHDARDLVRSRATSALATLHVTNGQLRVGEAPDQAAADADVWIFVGRRPLEQPRAAAAPIDRAAAALAGGAARYLDLAATDTRLYAVPVVAGGTRAGTVVAGISLAPYEQTRRLALIGSLVFGAIVLVIVALAARWLLAASLRPVVRMTRQAATWSDRDLDRRFGLGAPHDELSELGATLDGLLDRLAASLRREQRFSAEVAHELRTPLARVLAETELALRRERGADEYRRALELVHANAEQLARTVDALVAAARYEAVGEHGSADARDVAEDAVRVCSGLASERGLDLKIAEPTPRLRIGLDGDLAERILQPRERLPLQREQHPHLDRARRLEHRLRDRRRRRGRHCRRKPTHLRAGRARRGAARSARCPCRARTCALAEARPQRRRRRRRRPDRARRAISGQASRRLSRPATSL